MKGPMNPPLKVGDRIFLYHMEGETSVTPGTTGLVTNITRDPFELGDEKIVTVKWENGSTLQLLTATDAWKKIEPDAIQEQKNGGWDYITQNKDIFDNFDWRWLEQFLYKVRNSGIVNMLGASKFLYSGRDHIDRYYGEGREDDDAFQEVLDNAEEAKMKIIQGVIKYMQNNNKDLSNISQVNATARRFADKILGLYIAISEYRNKP